MTTTIIHRRVARTAFLCVLGVLGGGVLPAEDPLPPGATRTGAGSYTYVDKDGKKKLVSKTPFGVSVKEIVNEPEPARPAARPPKIEEKGDTVTFRRQTPFGESVWHRKRSELTAQEKEWLAAPKADPAPAPEARDAAQPQTPAPALTRTAARAPAAAPAPQPQPTAALAPASTPKAKPAPQQPATQPRTAVDSAATPAPVQPATQPRTAAAPAAAPEPQQRATQPRTAAAAASAAAPAPQQPVAAAPASKGAANR